MVNKTNELTNLLGYLFGDLYRVGHPGDEIIYLNNIRIGNKCTVTRDILHNLTDYETNIKLIDALLEKAVAEDIEYLIKIKELYNDIYNIEIPNINIRDTLKYDIGSFNSEFSRFRTFCDSQNKYDNMISIMKIVERLMVNRDCKLVLDYEFDSECDEDFWKDIETDLKSQIYNEFIGLRFQL